ncbi:MAG: DUF262 domain-containing protein [Steroidobacteraceae bacterium]
MNKSQFEAGTFGIGELITQRKLFRVPPHQRSYAWSRDEVATFLHDIEAAFVSNAGEYFVGLVVIQGPEDGEWTLLDGQQRLSTSTMIFASIRNWLGQQQLDEDSRQIETEFLGVRRLGGEYSSRMQLNDENQQQFNTAVIVPSSSDSLKAMLTGLPKRSSNKLLVEAALECQMWIERICAATSGDQRDRAERLFRLAAFMESRVKVVCVEVSNDVDPYILFESLNDRGVELSALDLLKNYAYSKSSSKNVVQFDQRWHWLVAELNGRNPDDFLKVSWTAAYGVVQKTQLFRNIRKNYRSQSEVLQFLDTLINDARVLSALEDPEHVLWNDYPSRVRSHIVTLSILGSRQVRSAILAGISRLQPENVERLLWYLIVVVIRFQIVGRGRTGVMEKVFGSLCLAINSSAVTSARDLQRELRELYVADSEFTTAFALHEDTKLSRFAYFLAELELCQQPQLQSIQQILAEGSLARIVAASDVESEIPKTIGAFSLFETRLLKASTHNYKPDELETSSFVLTQEAERFFCPSGEFDSQRRGLELAALAASVWDFDV